MAKFFQYQELINVQTTLLQDNLYAAQNEVEIETKVLDDEFKVIPLGNALDTTLYDESKKVVMFGKGIACYYVSADVKASGTSETAFRLDTGVADFRVPIKPGVPTIEKATLEIGAKQPEVVYFATGEQAIANAKVKIDGNELNFQKNIYQWYIGDEYYHIIPNGEQEYITKEISVLTEYPSCPSNFNSIVGEKNNKYLIKEEDKGKVLACSVTAGSKFGTMGNTLATNFIYVSPLPKLAQGEYKLLIDPSVNTEKMKTDLAGMNHYIYSERPDNNVPANAHFEKDSDNMAEVKGGIDIQSITGGIKPNFYRTHYLSFNDAIMRNPDGWYNNESNVYAVAKSSTFASGGFVKQYDTDKYVLTFDPNISGDWKLYTGKFDESWSKAEIGGNGLDLAEFIIVNRPSEEDNKAIIDYLNKKHGLLIKNP
ncbi:MAG: hypothetical protein RSF81_03115 [Oscillospiraceae bacterium]